MPKHLQEKAKALSAADLHRKSTAPGQKESEESPKQYDTSDIAIDTTPDDAPDQADGVKDQLHKQEKPIRAMEECGEEVDEGRKKKAADLRQRLEELEPEPNKKRTIDQQQQILQKQTIKRKQTAAQIIKKEEELKQLQQQLRTASYTTKKKPKKLRPRNSLQRCIRKLKPQKNSNLRGNRSQYRKPYLPPFLRTEAKPTKDYKKLSSRAKSCGKRPGKCKPTCAKCKEHYTPRAQQARRPLKFTQSTPKETSEKSARKAAGRLLGEVRRLKPIKKFGRLEASTSFSLSTSSFISSVQARCLSGHGTAIN